MKIIEKSRDFSAKEIYRMTEDRAVVSVKDVADHTVLNVNGFLIFEDTNANDEKSEILAIMGAEKNGEVTVWACQSATFKRSFMNIVDINAESGIDIELEPLAIEKLSGTTKAGRDYVDCRWV